MVERERADVPFTDEVAFPVTRRDGTTEWVQLMNAPDGTPPPPLPELRRRLQAAIEQWRAESGENDMVFVYEQVLRGLDEHIASQANPAGSAGAPPTSSPPG
jgi:hypothetical protein